ncbi:tail fiber protein [Photorhabdus temperata]|uniref:tail fiber protein n=1 Tax=Photorhabdus temperata TaxID=574560 RepID=UPI0003FE5804|nr:tail fiber protein [Photorhabdus temperata]
MRINNDKLEVDNHHGIEIVNEGVKVKAGEGIKVDDKGVSLKMGKPINNTYSPLILEPKNDILSVQLGDGLINRDNRISVNPGNGIKVDYNYVSVKAGNGITVNSDGVSIDLNTVLPSGMIVMFSGDSAPTGWAFCNGDNGTPDLRNRFVMCGETISETGKSSHKARGSKNEKEFSINTEPTEVSVTVHVKNTTLTEAQIPSHNHIEGMPYSLNNAIKYGRLQDPSTGDAIHNSSENTNVMTPTTLRIYPYTSETGGGEGHDHQATASSPSHNHRVDVIPPYYLLAFIMKL